MRLSSIAIAALSIIGCFGKIAPQPSDGGPFDDGSFAGDAGLDGDSRAPFPAPTCRGQAQCLQDDGGLTRTSSIEILCDPVPLPGPWNLAVQRELNGAFRDVTSAVIDTPGFGATIYDTSAPPAFQLTYRVCTVDDSGLNCGKPFETRSAPSCITCTAFTCEGLRTCDITTSNGCNNIIICGACPNGGTCNRTIFGEHTCCAPGFQSDGLGGCECAPPKPCPPRMEWEAFYCDCRPIFKPVPVP